MYKNKTYRTNEKKCPVCGTIVDEDSCLKGIEWDSAVAYIECPNWRCKNIGTPDNFYNVNILTKKLAKLYYKAHNMNIIISIIISLLNYISKEEMKFAERALSGAGRQMETRKGFPK